MKKKFWFLISILIVGALVLSACSSGGGGSTLRGKVVYDYQDDSSMVYNAEVLLDGVVRGTTDYQGEFYISGLNEDSYTLRIRKKDAIEDLVETVYPGLDDDLKVYRVQPVSDTTTITGQVNISNLTKYDDSTVSSSSVLNSASNSSRFNKEKFVKDEIIVKYDNLKIPTEKTVEEMIEYFSKQPGVEYAEPNYYVYAQAIPNDYRYQDNSGNIIQWGSIAVNLEAAWDVQKHSNSVTVAVLDSGIIPGHEDLEGNISGGLNFVGGSNTGDPSDYSPIDSRIDLVAPGGNSSNGILSTWGYYDNLNYIADYEYMNGTSMASSYVSGAAALLLEKGVRPQDVRGRLTSTAVDLGAEGKDDQYGYGLLDVYGALINERLEAPYVFAATENNGTITIESNSTRMNSDGSYSLYDRISGDYYMVAWRDINDNYEIDSGDYFGRTDTTANFQPGGVFSNQNIDMYYVTSSSSAASLSVEGIEKLRE